MPIEHKAHRPSSRLLVHLSWLLDEALEQTFPASDPVAIDIDRESHDREAGVFNSRTPLAGNRKVSTERVSTSPRGLLTAEMRSKLTVALTACCNIWP